MAVEVPKKIVVRDNDRYGSGVPLGAKVPRSLSFRGRDVCGINGFFSVVGDDCLCCSEGEFSYVSALEIALLENLTQKTLSLQCCKDIFATMKVVWGRSGVKRADLCLRQNSCLKAGLRPSKKATVGAVGSMRLSFRYYA